MCVCARMHAGACMDLTWPIWVAFPLVIISASRLIPHSFLLHPASIQGRASLEPCVPTSTSAPRPES